MATRKGDFRQRIRVDPSLKAFARQLGEIPKELNDYRPAWRQLAVFMARGIKENIQSRGASIGESWAPLTKEYEIRKKQDGFGRMELQRTGQTVAELTSPRSTVSLTKRRVSFGVRGKKWAHVPSLNFGLNLEHARPFMGWSRSMVAANDRVMTQHAEGVLKRAADKISRSRPDGG